MKTSPETTKYTIDATGKRLGKVAVEAATLLQGKNRADFARHTVAPVHVTIENASKMDMTEKKSKGTIYQSYSGYPGGRRVETLEHLGGRLGYKEAVRRTVKGMLPKNKLQAVLMKQLTVTE
jgi:large subunit ribosomal protein L13